MLREQKPIDKCRSGDIVAWENRAHGKKEWRVVQNWCGTEPRQLLVTGIDAEDGKCFVALADDCELVESRDLPAPSFRREKREPARELPKHQIPREEM
jgi:hypothetical protein